MTLVQIILIVVAVLLFKFIIGSLNGYYWKSKMVVLANILNSKVNCPFGFLPSIMSIRGRYKEREVKCSFNGLVLKGFHVRIAMKPHHKLPNEPNFMVSYKKPTPNTIRQGDEIVYIITTGVSILKEYTESGFIDILDELTEATEKLESKVSVKTV